MNIKNTLFGTSAILLASSAQAFTIGGSYGVLSDNGSALTAPTRTMMVIDTGDNGLLDLASWDGSTYSPGSDDIVVQGWDELTGDGDGFEANAAFAAVKNGVLGVTNGYSVTLNADGVTDGDDIYLFWFAGLDALGAGPGAGQDYGYVKIGEAPAVNTGAVAPTILSFSNIAGASFGTTAPIPEPTSLALLGLGGLAVLRRRRG